MGSSTCNGDSVKEYSFEAPKGSRDNIGLLLDSVANFAAPSILRLLEHFIAVEDVTPAADGRPRASRWLGAFLTDRPIFSTATVRVMVDIDYVNRYHTQYKTIYGA